MEPASRNLHLRTVSSAENEEVSSRQIAARLRILRAIATLVVCLVAARTSAYAQATLSTKLVFGNTALNEPSATQTATLKNTQTVALIISSIANQGVNPGDFSLGTNCPGALPAGKSCTITVTFTPSALGSRTATLTVSDDASNSPQTTALSGTGVEPATLSMAALTFGSVAEGTTSIAKTETLTNNQLIPLNISSIATNAGGGFAVTGGTCPPSGSLAAKGHCTILVTLSPTIVGAEAGTLAVTDDASNNPQSATLTGTGIIPVTLSSSTMTFANTYFGNTSVTKNVVLTNRESAALTFTSILPSGDFSIVTNTCGATVLAGKTCSIGLQFSPTIVGADSGTLTFTDGAVNSPQIVNLTGNALVPVSVTPITLTFASQLVGTTSAAKTVTLTNHSASAVTINTVLTSGDFSVASNTCGSSLGGNLTCTVGVAFSPTASGSRTGVFQVSDNFGRNTSIYTVNLSGTGNVTGLKSITVTPANASIAAGTAQQFTAMGTYSNNTMADLTNAVTWGSSAMGVATINPSGLATGVSQGQTTITATFGAISGMTMLSVAPPSLVSIAVTPANPSIPVGGSQQFTATGTYTDNSTQDLTATATWSSSAMNVVTINASGLATTVTPGQTTIQASFNGINGSTALTVTAAFIATGSLNTARYTQTATLLNNGEVLIAGGVGTAVLSSAELYDPGSGTFITTGSLTIPRTGHTATLLNSGMVLLAGGGGSAGILASAELYDPASGTFTPTGSLNAARQLATATLLNNGMVLIAGGQDQNGNPLSSAELYDPATGTFSLTGSLNTARCSHTATLLNNGMVLIAGGTNNSLVGFNSAELYDPATGMFSPTGSMVNGHVLHTATLLNGGSVLITGGLDQNIGPSAAAELYNPSSGTFASVGSMSTPRLWHTATLMNNGMVLVAGGSQNTECCILASAELFEPSQGIFTTAGNMTSGRVYQAAVLLNDGEVLVTGGLNGGNFNNPTTPPFATPLSSAELYEPATLTPPNLVSIGVTPDSPTVVPGETQPFIAVGTFSDDSTEQLNSVTWSSSDSTAAQISNDVTDPGVAVGIAAGTVTVKATDGSVSGSATLTVRSAGTFAYTGSLNTARSFQTATLLNDGRVLIAGGGNSVGFSPTAELYNPATRTFTTTGTLSDPRYDHTATLLNNGMVLIAGGGDSNGTSSSAELYNPATGTFNLTGSLNTARYWHTATLLNNGMVLIAGGFGPNGALASAELYDPATGTFRLTGGLNTARGEHTATVLNNGMVLVAGGVNSGGVLTSAELYNPATGTFALTGSLNTSRYTFTATPLTDGTVLIAGGYNNNGGIALVSAELYNPASGTFAATGSLNTGRYEHTAILLNNGMVLIAGGSGTSAILASAELYNPMTGTFSATGSLNDARCEHTATLLNNGVVLIAGGESSNSFLSSAEVY